VKRHPLTLNNGAMHRLSVALSTPGLLTKPADAFVAGGILESHLLTLPHPPDLPEDCQRDQGKAMAFVRAWERDGAHAFELTERERDVCKTAVRAAIERGVLSGAAGTHCLMRELGLGEE
jgi:hypothetical protein